MDGTEIGTHASIAELLRNLEDLRRENERLREDNFRLMIANDNLNETLTVSRRFERPA